DLSNNALTGSIPDIISLLTALNNLDLSYNSLTGSVPGSVFLLADLSFLNVNGNHLNGTISPFLSLLKLKSLNVTGTNLTCPPDNTDCGTTQNARTAFCQTCESFCRTCGKPAGK
ncbi:unnamed protein product, partial [Closterium sp. NIES-54]